MEQFTTIEMLGAFSSLVMIVFTIVAFSKNFKFITHIGTDNYSWCVSMILIVYYQLMVGEFKFSYIPLYAISSIFVSASAGKLSDKTQKKIDKTE